MLSRIMHCLASTIQADVVRVRDTHLWNIAFREELDQPPHGTRAPKTSARLNMLAEEIRGTIWRWPLEISSIPDTGE
jgi:hypothetical protein